MAREEADGMAAAAEGNGGSEDIGLRASEAPDYIVNQ